MEQPQQLFDAFEAKMAAAQQHANQMAAEMEQVTVGERSRDGQIAVEVDHLGNLTGLQIGAAARAKPDLAEEIMRTMRAAQSKLAEAVRTGVPSISGSETEAEVVGRLHSMYPEPEPDSYVEGGAPEAAAPNRFIPEEERHETAPQPKPQPKPEPKPKPPAPPRPQRPDAPQGHDDDYFSGGFLR
ncbi:YbaB/EbfC family nucleoid-associated protein [Amycolatopsis nigrescens]|uniref:YbaB/EbfC family nucleoid-associated protein n=1 Tax=Amycolatopsis nigrescens TaxID=381445 RepID=UPI0003759C8D|nr:YbaB/EbfC family nucleoid-associated protein [Amycolatopsis nigrescens]